MLSIFFKVKNSFEIQKLGEINQETQEYNINRTLSSLHQLGTRVIHIHVGNPL